MALPVWGESVHGRVEIVSSQDPAVRKNSDYSGVVVWLEPLSGPLAAAAPRKAEMIQKGKRFTPHLLAITAGTSRQLSQLRSYFSQRVLELRR